MYSSKNRCNVGVPHPPTGFVWKWPENNESLSCEQCDNRLCKDYVCFQCEARCKQHHMTDLPVLKHADKVPAPPEGFRWKWPIDGNEELNHFDCEFKCHKSEMPCLKCIDYISDLGLYSLPILEKI